MGQPRVVGSPVRIGRELGNPQADGGLRLQVVNMSLQKGQPRASSFGGSAMVSRSPSICHERSGDSSSCA
jgi:hypothetical protein